MSTIDTTFQARMKNPALVIPEAMPAIQTIMAATRKGDVPESTLQLIHLRISQINGCSSCVDSGSKHAKQMGESDERLYAVAAWHNAPYFTSAERAALALSETMTRLSDRSDPVSDEVWAEAARHYDERGLAAIVLAIAMTNVFNRLNVATKQPAGSWRQ